jgi:VWFA-related protein
MPPGYFTDYTPVAPNGTLNILLLDALNTPMKDQMFVRQQLLDFVKHEKPGTRIAIFGLSSQLYMLQGFTSDPQVLQDAMEHHLGARSSALLDDPTGSGAEPEKLSDLAADAMPSGAGATQTIADLQQFEAQQAAFQTQLRVQYTMDAFNALGHYLANFPGRKNLIWFSGSFPLDILPNPTIKDPFAVVETNNDEFRNTANLLARSRVSVYPVDARGLMAQPMFDASRSGSQYVRNPSAFANDLQAFSASQAAEHATMNVLAHDTGGHAFYNTNGLSVAVAKAIDAGSNYYTLTYSPTDHNWNGAYRSIHVELTGAAAARGLHLAYRSGYFADDPDHPSKHTELATTNTTTSPPNAEPRTTPADHAAEAYTRAAISRGAPEPSDILFKVRVLPLSASTVDTVTSDDAPNPIVKMKPPFRRYAIDYAALVDEIALVPQPDGRRKGNIEFDVLVYDANGTLLNRVGKILSLDLTSETYKRISSGGVGSHLEVSAPARQPSFLRLVVHDLTNNHYGVVEIPTAQVSRLTPLPPSAAAPAKPAEPAATR